MIRLYIVILCFAVSACNSSNNDVENKIQLMKSQKISLPFKQFSCLINDSTQTNSLYEQTKIKLVVYTDSASCSQCALKQLYLWKDFIDLEQQYNHKFSIFFIFHSGNANPQAMISVLKHTGFQHPIYVDFTNVFLRENPHIPTEKMFHVFLLDENDNVMLVGSPLFNPKLENVMHKILKEKFGDSMFKD